MSRVQVGQDGEYRMVIEERYKKIGGVRREAKFFAILSGALGVVKMILTTLPTLLDGQPQDNLYAASVVALVAAFLLYSLASGGGKPHKEIKLLLWLYIIVAAALGSKALLDAWHNPIARQFLLTPRPPSYAPYDPTVARLLVKFINSPPETVQNDVDAINLLLNGGSAFALLASAAANIKYLSLQRQAKKAAPPKKTS